VSPATSPTLGNNFDAVSAPTLVPVLESKENFVKVETNKNLVLRHFFKVSTFDPSATLRYGSGSAIMMKVLVNVSPQRYFTRRHLKQNAGQTQDRTSIIFSLKK
jgi:hypothetical protein